MTEPRTEAGRRLLDAIRSGVAGLFARSDTGDPYGPDEVDPILETILAIEDEARQQGAQEARAFLEARDLLLAYRGGTDDAYQEQLERDLAAAETALRAALADASGG